LIIDSNILYFIVAVTVAAMHSHPLHWNLLLLFAIKVMLGCANAEAAITAAHCCHHL